MSSGGDPVTIGYRYFMKLHMGVCRGPVDALVEIKIGDKTAWPVGSTVQTAGGCTYSFTGIPGINLAVVETCVPPSEVIIDSAPPVTTSGTISINVPELFGGEEKEGGVQGSLEVLMGEANQPVNPRLQAFLGGLVSGFRGMFTLFFDGMICAMSAYPKPWKFRVRRALMGWDGAVWYPEKAVIELFRPGETPAPASGATETVTLSQYSYVGSDGLTIPWYTDGILATSVLSVFYRGFEIGTPQLDAGAVSWTTAEVIAGTYIAPGEAVEILYTIDRLAPPAAVNGGLSTERATIKAMNPAHIIYECLTNRDWGRGLPRAKLDNETFTKVADSLYAEKLGLCIRWTREDTVEAFVQQVIDHIGGVLFESRESGLIHLRIMRDATRIEDLTEFTTSSGILSIEEDDSSSPQTLINEVVLSYTDAVTGDTRQVRAQNVGSAQATGAIYSKSVSYPGIPTPELAARLAQRDLRVGGTPIRRFKFIMDRRAWRLTPGQVFRFSDANRSIGAMLLRVGKIEDRSQDDGTMAVTALQDVFGLSATSFVGSDPIVTPPSGAPPIAATATAMVESPYIFLLKAMAAPQFYALTGNETFVTLLSVRPTPLSLDYGIHTGITGGAFSVKGTGKWTPSCVCVLALTPLQTSIVVSSLVGQGIVAGLPAMINDEIVRIVSFDAGTGVMAIARGCADTIPQSHAALSRMYFYLSGWGRDPTYYSETEEVTGRALTRTSNGTLAFSLAPPVTKTMVLRHPRPYPPANVQFNGIPFPNVISRPGSFALSWFHRNRLTQFENLVYHQDSSVSPEAGTTYTVKITNRITSAVLRTVAGITGLSYTYNYSDWQSDGSPYSIRVELWSVRSALESYQKYVVDFFMTQGVAPGTGTITLSGNEPKAITKGWGVGWGYDWGGTP